MLFCHRVSTLRSNQRDNKNSIAKRNSVDTPFAQNCMFYHFFVAVKHSQQMSELCTAFQHPWCSIWGGDMLLFVIIELAD
jgi:hypothetical protein